MIEESESLEVPSLEKPKDMKDILAQIALVSEAIDKCEKILTHLAMASVGTASSGYGGEEIDTYVMKHLELVSMRNNLYLLKKGYVEPNQKNDSSLTIVSKKSWNIWKLFN